MLIMSFPISIDNPLALFQQDLNPWNPASYLLQYFRQWYNNFWNFTWLSAYDIQKLPAHTILWPAFNKFNILNIIKYDYREEYKIVNLVLFRCMGKNITKNHGLNTKINIKVLLLAFWSYNVGSPKGRTYFELYFPQTSGEQSGHAGHIIFSGWLQQYIKTVLINVAI